MNVCDVKDKSLKKTCALLIKRQHNPPSATARGGKVEKEEKTWDNTL